MHKQTLISVFNDLDRAREVIRDLEANAIHRADIGLAVSDKSYLHPEEIDTTPGTTAGRAMVTVTVADSEVERIRQVITCHNPEQLDVRNAQWRIGGSTDFFPNADDFIALDIEKQRTS